jgi:DNA polymerase-3 subunit gamma/tau
VRIAYSADLPTPDEVIRSLESSGANPRASSPAAAVTAAAPGPVAGAPRFDAPRIETSRGAPRAALGPSADPMARVAEPEPSPPALVIGRFEDLIALAAQKRDLGVKFALERDVRLVRCEDGRLEIGLEPSAAKTLVNDLARKFSQWTNRRWMVAVSAEAGQPTVKSQNETRQAELKVGVRADPLVQAVLARFPGAEVVDVRKTAPILPADLPAGDGEDAVPEFPPDDDGSAFGAHMRTDDDV